MDTLLPDANPAPEHSANYWHRRFGEELARRVADGIDEFTTDNLYRALDVPTGRRFRQRLMSTFIQPLRDTGAIVKTDVRMSSRTTRNPGYVTVWCVVHVAGVSRTDREADGHDE
jgi:hypothetical protein